MFNEEKLFKTNLSKFRKDCKIVNCNSFKLLINDKSNIY